MGQLLLHGYTGAGLIGTGMEYFLNGVSIAKVKKNDRNAITINQGGALTAKLGGIRMSNNSIDIDETCTTEIAINHNAATGKFDLVVVSTLVSEAASESSETGDSFSSVSNDEFDENSLPYELDGGVKDYLEIFEDRVIIKHRGVLNAISMGVKGDKTIYYSDITSVQYKKPGFSSGYIQLSIPGGNENKGGVFSAMSDENTVAISADANLHTVSKVVDFINKKIGEAKRTRNDSTTIVQQVSAADELKKFKELLDQGIITQEEFDAKKKQLLGL